MLDRTELEDITGEVGGRSRGREGGKVELTVELYK